jgi:hypothetical protein
MQTEQSTLREAENKITTIGILKEKKLDIIKGDKGEFITGELLIQTDDTNVHTFNVFSFRKTRDGGESKIFKGMCTVKDEYISIADCIDRGIDVSNASKVVVSGGKLGLNEYYDDTKNLKSSWKLSTSFINTLRSGVPYTPKSEFTIEGFITAIKTDPKTERVVVDMIVPIYGGKVIPLTFATTPDSGSYIENNYSKGETVLVWGDIVNVADIREERKSGFGVAKVNTVVNYRRELLITGGEERGYDEDDPKTFNAKDIKEALKEREEYLASLLAKATSKDSSSSQTKTTTGAKADTDKFKF